jgi:hypothetical protein
MRKRKKSSLGRALCCVWAILRCLVKQNLWGQEAFNLIIACVQYE